MNDGITLVEAKEMVSLYLKALKAVSSGQSYSISTGGGNRSLTRANMGEISKELRYWRSECDRLSNGGRGGIQSRRIVPIG